MEEQLVSFEIAKLAKEKGFDEPTYNRYNKLGVLEKSHKRDHNAIRWNNASEDAKRIKFYSAPTSSLLQKWLREKHNIILLVDPVVMERYPHSIWYCVSAKYISKNPCKMTYLGISGDYYKSWETACNKGLKIILEQLSNE